MYEILSLKNINKVYETKQIKQEALKNVSLSLYENEFVAIMGKSGSGKSTFLNIIAALDKPTKGDVFLDGSKVNEFYDEPMASNYRGENIGFIFQDFNLFKDLTVEENIVLPLILKGTNFNEANTKTEEVMKKLNIYEWKKHRPIELSGGQQQRVAIGRAIITKPKILLADEPTGNLDYSTSIDILKILKDMKNELKQSILLVTHDPEVASYADRVIFFHDGEIIYELKLNHNEKDIDLIMNIFKKTMRL